MNWETLLCLGDSITIGARSYIGYPEYLGNMLEKQLGSRWNIINHATSGDTVIQLHRSMTKHFQALQNHQVSAATILIGTNDLKGPTDPEDFRIAYRQVLLKTRLIVGNNDIFLIKIPKIPAVVKYPYRFDMNKKIDEFNAIIEDLGESHRHKVVEISLASKDLFDGVHLNSEGAKSFAKQLLHYILLDKGVLQENHASTATL